MSEFEMDFGQELIEIIAHQIGDRGLKAFIRDFAEWSEYVLDDEDYVEVEGDSLSSSESESDDDLPQSVEVEEQYETEVDENGFHSLKDCVVKTQK